MTLAATGDALVGLWFDGQKFFGSTLAGEQVEQETEVLRQARRWLDAYFSGKRPDSTPQLRMVGSPFRLAVWKLLLEIPWGPTLTYGQLAARMEKAWSCGKVSARAVGGAVGHNPISLIIPCHRVVGASGSPTGYAGGLDRKACLLRHELLHCPLAATIRRPGAGPGRRRSGAGGG